jgi:hypothetical protein
MVAPNSPLRDLPLFYTQEQMFVPHIEEQELRPGTCVGILQPGTSTWKFCGRYGKLF